MARGGLLLADIVIGFDSRMLITVTKARSKLLRGEMQMVRGRGASVIQGLGDSRTVPAFQYAESQRQYARGGRGARGAARISPAANESREKRARARGRDKDFHPGGMGSDQRAITAVAVLVGVGTRSVWGPGGHRRPAPNRVGTGGKHRHRGAEPRRRYRRVLVRPGSAELTGAARAAPDAHPRSARVAARRVMPNS